MVDVVTLESLGLNDPHSMVGGFDGSSRSSRELATWLPSMSTVDVDLSAGNKDILDARSGDMSRNSGLANGGIQIHRDSIVGSHFKLNSKPNYKVLGLDGMWAHEFQEEVESKFTLYAESPNHWVDASRMNTLTSMVRLVVGTYALCGENLATAEWLRDSDRPFNTAIQMIDTARLSNPQGVMNTDRLRNGVQINRYGAPQGYHIRSAHPGDLYHTQGYTWKYVPVRKPWGRIQVLHNLEQSRIDQHRGIGDMVSVLKEMKMHQKFSDITLQNAVLNATYAAAIESDLPPEQAFEAIGGGAGEAKVSWAEDYLASIATYASGSKNMHIDGVKIPHLFPGTKLKMMTPGDPKGIGQGFEESLLRHIATALGLSYEQFSRDFTKTNYSSARATMGETWKFMMSRKKMVADRFANSVFALWLEEAIGKGHITSMPQNPPNFWDGLNKEAYAQCTWIGAARGQIDEKKETESALMRVNGNLSTLEDECAKLGKDYREVLTQKAKEKTLLDELGLSIVIEEPDSLNDDEQKKQEADEDDE